MRTARKVHKARAKGFHQCMRSSPPNSVSYCFDLQQVQYLPKLPIGEVFYKRQLALYAFCVCRVEPGRPRSPEFYTWMQHEGDRGSEEISSALVHFLDSNQSFWSPDTDTLYLFCDGCGGQNKNQHVVHSLAFWLHHHSPPCMTKIVMVFPVRGHSFLPADGVFGHVEQDLRKIPEIVRPDDYHNIYSNHGLVRVVNKVWTIRQFKQLSEYMIPLKGMQDAKRIIIKKDGDTVRCKMENLYFTDNKAKRAVNIMKTVNKKSLKLSSIKLPQKKSHPIPLREPVKKDLQEILKIRYGENWENCTALKFYKDVLNIVPSHSSEASEEQIEEDECDCCSFDTETL